MIFVATGTGGYDPLVKKMDELSPDLGEEVIVQTGFGEYRPVHCQHFQFTPDLTPYYQAARLVVAAGGLGITTEALRWGKPLVAVDNPIRSDPHQRDLLGTLEAAGHLIWCRDLESLPATLAEAATRQFTPYQPPECTMHWVIHQFLQSRDASVMRPTT